MPPLFTKYFAERLNATVQVEVKEAESGDRIAVGRVLIAPGDRHLELVRQGGDYLVRCKDGEKVKGHRPSVDVLFKSVAEQVGANAVGMILTGMGSDGAEGLKAMRAEGARTFAQDESSSVVFGMPKEAYLNGGVEKLVPLDTIPQTLVDAIKDMK
jgi:two-component system chemotaxis response regulator CheB